MPLTLLGRRSLIYAMPQVGALFNGLRAEARGYANAAVHLSVSPPTISASVQVAAKVTAAANVALSGPHASGAAQIKAMIALIARLQASLALLKGAIDATVGLYAYAGRLEQMGQAWSKAAFYPPGDLGYAVVLAGGADAGVALGRLMPAVSFTQGRFRKVLSGTLAVCLPPLPMIAADLTAKIPRYLDAAARLNIFPPALALAAALRAAASYSVSLAVSPPAISASATAAIYLGLAAAINVILAFFVDASVGVYEHLGELNQMGVEIGATPGLVGDGYAVVLAGDLSTRSTVQPLFGGAPTP